MTLLTVLSPDTTGTPKMSLNVKDSVSNADVPVIGRELTTSEYLQAAMVMSAPAQFVELVTDATAPEISTDSLSTIASGNLLVAGNFSVASATAVIHIEFTPVSGRQVLVGPFTLTAGTIAISTLYPADLLKIINYGYADAKVHLVSVSSGNVSIELASV